MADQEKCASLFQVFSLKALRKFSRLSIMLCIVIVAALTAVLSQSKERYIGLSGEKIEATDECSRQEASPAHFDMNFDNARALLRRRNLQVVLHQSEGCLRIDQELEFAGIKRSRDDFQKIIRRQAFGRLKIVNLQKILFPNFSKSRRRYLEDRLMKSNLDLQNVKFVVVDLQLVSKLGNEEKNEPDEELEETNAED